MQKYDFGQGTRKGDFLPDLKSLYKNSNPLNRFKDKTFFFRSSYPDVKIDSFDPYEKGKEQKFYISIPISVQEKMIKDDESLKYCWGVSAPHM